MILEALGTIAIAGLLGFMTWDRHQMCTALIEGDLRRYHATDIEIARDWMDLDRDTLTFDVTYRDPSGSIKHNRCKVSTTEDAVFWTDLISPRSA